jgi:hypothetical protein
LFNSIYILVEMPQPWPLWVIWGVVVAIGAIVFIRVVAEFAEQYMDTLLDNLR